LLVTRAGEALLTELFDAAPRDAEPFARRLLDPVVRAIPFIVSWAYYRRHMLEEAALFTEGTRQATVRRVYVYAIALIGLALTGYGLAGLIAVTIDRTAANSVIITTSGSDAWRAEVAGLASLTLVGAAAWLWHWAQVQDWLRREPEVERNATVRRVYLFTAIAGSIVALLVSLAVVIYRVFAEILGVEDVNALADDLGLPAAVLLVAAVVLVYHALLLRDDLGEREAAPDLQLTTLQFVVSGPPGADPDAVVAAVQSALPQGYVVRTVTRSE
jgi:hypothetical protein